MTYLRILSGQEKPLDIYQHVVTCIEDIHTFPDMIETLYRQAIAFDEETLDPLGTASSACLRHRRTLVRRQTLRQDLP